MPQMTLEQRVEVLERILADKIKEEVVEEPFELVSAEDLASLMDWSDGDVDQNAVNNHAIVSYKRALAVCDAADQQHLGPHQNCDLCRALEAAGYGRGGD